MICTDPDAAHHHPALPAGPPPPPAVPVPAPAAVPPEPFLLGSFGIYAMPDGGFLIAWKRKGDGETRHLPVPAALLTMAAAQTGKSREEIIAELTGVIDV